ncbi:MAG: MBL fold metallo-hydrolase [Anaerolineae bacterium]|jgi:glyoxylase-like metal-dependent hydrolase (beta-lactamase superfamily II)|nr:MBL fold metallo-hydrolase [Anaerolineae bacterium]
MRRIMDNVFTFPFFMGFLNLYLIDTPEGMVLIDAGVNRSQIDQVLESLTQSGRNARDLKHVFITHAHYDHTGGLAYLQQVTDIQTHVHQNDAPIVRGETQAMMPRPEDLKGLWRVLSPAMKANTSAPARVDREVKGGDRLGGILEVIELPGHSAGHSALWWAEKRILFAGDLVIRLPWGLMTPIPNYTPDMPEALRSIRKAADLDVETLCICHGQVIQKDASAQLNTFLNSKVKG